MPNNLDHAKFRYLAHSQSYIRSVCMSDREQIRVQPIATEVSPWNKRSTTTFADLNDCHYALWCSQFCITIVKTRRCHSLGTLTDGARTQASSPLVRLSHTSSRSRRTGWTTRRGKSRASRCPNSRCEISMAVLRLHRRSLSSKGQTLAGLAIKGQYHYLRTSPIIQASPSWHIAWPRYQ